MRGNIHAKLLKYGIEQRLLHNKELQQRLLLLKNGVMLRKHFLKNILESERSEWYCLHLAKFQELFLPTITLIGKGENSCSLCS